ncbi:Transporter [uncultured Candidatus Thioglobus sp.]|nr:Transporter [uncultured Candidatus Thioglobus sp.]
MLLFKISESKLIPVEKKNFSLEKELQSLIESNLETVFNCRFVATEFSTGAQHAGRIDSLALSEDDNPVIIEYKKIESSELINQSLFYLHWIQDHKGDFEIAVQKELGNEAKVDWTDIRVICIAQNYKEFDIHAVQYIDAKIELWEYRLFKNNSFSLEEVLHNTKSATVISQGSNKNPIMVEAGKKSAQVRTTASYTLEEHFGGKSKEILELMQEVSEFVTGLDSAIKEVPKKHYIAYKSSKNIVCMEVRSKKIKLSVTLKPSEVLEPPKCYRDVSKIGHYGTGEVEFTISTPEEFEETKQYIELAYNKIGG